MGEKGRQSLISKKRRVVLTGGHAGTTAIATVEAYLKHQRISQRELHWIGPKRPFEGAKHKTLEFEALPKMGVICHGIISGKIQSKFTRYTILAALRIPIGFLHALYLIVKVRPTVVLSFGGYAGVPVVFWAWIFRRPIVIHEQIAAAGLGNRLSAPFANKIAVAREDSREFFPKKKLVLTGNPILINIAEIRPKERLSDPVTLYIQGGSRGAVRINRIVEKILTRLLTDYRVIHQTGGLDIERYKEIKKKLPKKLAARYECFSFCSPFEIHRVYEKADVVIGRAGANTVAEVLAAGRPAIYIPIPWSIFNEQERNAAYAQKIGVARIVREDELSARKLEEEISKLIHDWKAMSEKGHSQKATFDERAAGNLVNLVEEEFL